MVIYMPMVPEAVIAMLACARLGAVHSVVFGGFAAHELADPHRRRAPRRSSSSASCGIEPARVVEYKPMLDRALELAAHAAGARRGAAAAAGGRVDGEARRRLGRARRRRRAGGCVPVAATDPLYVLYTSGHDRQAEGRRPRQRRPRRRPALDAWRTSTTSARARCSGPPRDVGWVVGHSYIVYAPLLAGAHHRALRGQAGRHARRRGVLAGHRRARVKALFTAPTAFRAIKKDDPTGALLAGARPVRRCGTLFLAGERLDPDTYRWASELLGVPVIDHWWQTETGWPIAANLRGLEPMPIKPGSPTVPCPATTCRCSTRDGSRWRPGEEGDICLGCRCRRARCPRCGATTSASSTPTCPLPGYYLTGDGGSSTTTATCSSWAAPTTSSTSPGTGCPPARWRRCRDHPAVAECAVIGVHDQLKGQVPRGFVVLKAGVDSRPDSCGRARAAVRDEIGAGRALRDVDVVPALPKTRSGKILRRTMREIADGRRGAAVDHRGPGVLDILRPLLQETD